MNNAEKLISMTVQDIFSRYGVNDGSRTSVQDVRIYHPEEFGFDRDSRIHVLVQYSEEFSDDHFGEDILTDILNLKNLRIYDSEFDFNVISVEKTGTIDDYLEKMRSFNSERLDKKRKYYSSLSDCLERMGVSPAPAILGYSNSNDINNDFEM